MSSKLEIDKQLYYQQCGAVVEMINQAKSDYYIQTLSSADSKDMFKVINSLVSNQATPLLSSDSDTVLANKFAEFFHSKVATIRADLDAMDCTSVPDGDASQPVNCLLANFSEVSEVSLSKVITRAPSKSCSLDPVPTWFLKDPAILQSVLPTLTALVNTSLTSGEVPTCLKSALVTPILKKSGLDPDELRNHRPISNVPYASKVLERVAANQISEHLEIHGLRDSHQSAYRPNHSTETALVKIKNDIDLALDQGDGMLLVLLDLSAAFDTIDHQILLDRLEQTCGITGCVRQWLSSYLSDRTQTVIIGESLSEPRALNIGVPQGSVLGPLLFSAYIQPTGAIIKRHNTGHHGYADDTQLCRRFSPQVPGSLLAGINKLEACIDELTRWMTQNKLKLNNDKTEFMVIVSKHHQCLVDEVAPVLTLGDSVISPSLSVRNLGATFDTHMTMVPHINNVTRTSYFHLQTLSRIRRHVDKDTCAAAARALILSRLDYANSLLAGVPDNAMHKLQVVQNNAARLVTRTSRRAHITPVLRDLHWLPVRQRVRHKMMCLTFSALHSSTAPVYLADLLQRQQHTRALRSNGCTSNLVVPRTVKAVGDRAFSVFAPREWNLLPPDVRACSTYSSFRRSLKTCLFRRHFVQ